MCGISGYIHRNKAVSAAAIMTMNKAISHRGPDDEGFICIENDNTITPYAGKDSTPFIQQQLTLLNQEVYTKIALGFRRLAIIDISEKGHQPMISSEVAITFNGEIYNFKSLRKELEQQGCLFHSNTDTEVILQGYKIWGIDIVYRLNGMFAICIVDMRLQKTFLIRDRLGIKPLFYHLNADSITWCSEIKGILQAPWVNAIMNVSGLLLNYQFISSPAPSTCFEDIYALSPATWMEIAHSSLNIKKHQYWEIPTKQEKLNLSQKEIIAQVEAKIIESTQAQLMSDVPLITMMSGGIDSTLLTAMAHLQDSNLSCYTLSLDGSGTGFDELPQAQKMAKQIGIHQLVHHLDDDAIVDEAIAHIEHFEAPYNSLDVIFNASQFLNTKGYKVVISGNGADEVFGGYSYNLHLEKWNNRKRWKSLSPLIPAINEPLKKIKYHIENASIGDYFLSCTGGMRNYQLASLFMNESVKDIQALTKPYVSYKNFDTDYEGLFYYDLKYSVGAHHSYHDDICAMRYSVEMRYPYLDHELIELVAQLPLATRYNGIHNKPLLREVAKKYIHQDNLSMPKKGFTLPINRLMQSNKKMQDFVQNQINYLKSTQLFDAKTIDSIVLQGKQQQFYLYTWQLVTTAVWLKKYF